MPFEDNFNRAEQRLSSGKVEKARQFFGEALEEYRNVGKPPLNSKLTERYYQFEYDLVEKWLTEIEAEAASLGPEETKRRLDEFARNYSRVIRIFPDAERKKIQERITNLRDENKSIATPDLDTFKQQIEEYETALADAKARGTHFDPRVDFGGKGIPLIVLADLKKKAERWIPSQASSLEQVAERNKIVDEINRVDDLVAKFAEEVEAIDDDEYRKWTNPIDPADVAEASRLKGMPDLTGHDVTALNTEISALDAIHGNVDALLTGLSSRYAPADLKIFKDNYLNVDFDQLFSKQSKDLQDFLGTVQAETQRRKDRLRDLNRESSLQALRAAIDAVLNPSTPLEELYNSQIKTLLDNLENSRVDSQYYLEKNDSNKQYHDQIDRILADILKARREIDSRYVKEVVASRPWDSWVITKGWMKVGETCATEAVRKKVLQEFFNWLISTQTGRFWKDPNDANQLGFLQYVAWPMQAGNNEFTLDKIIDGFPGDQNHLRDLIKFFTHTFEGGINWHKIAEQQGPHDKVLEHLKHHMFNGKTWEEITHYPPLVPGDKKFGDLIFEGLDYYTHWNQDNVLLPSADVAAIKQGFRDDINAGRILLPADAELKRLAESKDKEAIVFKRNSSGIDPRVLLSIYKRAKNDYNAFKEAVVNTLSQTQRKNLESERQRTNGIFPLLDVSEPNQSHDRFGNDTNNRDKWRTEIAIGIGAYNSGFDGYDVMTGELIIDKVANTRRAATTAELTAFLEKGKAAELVAFHIYQTNMGSANDDNVNFLAKTKPTRVRFTSHYRNKYPGQEGVWNKDQFGALVPDPFQFMAANGTCLRDLFRDRSRRMTAEYGNMQDTLKIAYTDIYSYAIDMYDVLAYGLQGAIKEFHFDKLGQYVRETAGSLEEELSLDTAAINALTKFWRSTLGYWLDGHLVVSDIEMATGFYDPNFWVNVPGTNAYTPIFKKQMFILSPEERVNFENKVRGKSKKDVVIELQKAILASFTVESLLMLNTPKLSDAEIEAIVYAYSRHSDHNIKQENSGEAPIPGYNFTKEEVYGMLADADRIRKGLKATIDAFMLSEARF